ncbi:MAG: hypothetical protein R2713_20425 [Ilumatobacteraceae bacterium]
MAAYCAEVGANLDSLVSPATSTSADVDPLIDRYRSIAVSPRPPSSPSGRRRSPRRSGRCGGGRRRPATMEEASRAALAGNLQHQPAHPDPVRHCDRYAAATHEPGDRHDRRATVVSEGSPSSVGG